MKIATIHEGDISADCRRRSRLVAKLFFPFDETQAARLADFICVMLVGELAPAVERELARRAPKGGGLCSA